MGYARAGFEVVGVDIKPQPRYPFEFIQADAMTFPLEGFDAIHASPPCQAHSTIAKQQRARRPGKYDHPDLVDATRECLLAMGVPCVIENVEGAPLEALTLCGSSFGLDVRRHRLFEVHGFWLLAPPCAHHWQKPRFPTLDRRRTNASSVVAVYGTGSKLAPISSVVTVTGHVNYTGERAVRERAMGIDWMSPYELTQAIPPAYTEYIGTHLSRALQVEGEGRGEGAGEGSVTEA